MFNQEGGDSRISVDNEVKFNSFEAAADQLKADCQRLLVGVPIYEEMKETRLEFALGDNEDFLKAVYGSPNNFYRETSDALNKFGNKIRGLNQEKGYSYAAIIEAMKRTERVLYVSPKFVVDEVTEDKKHVGLFLADDSQLVITYHIEPREGARNMASEIVKRGLLSS